MRALLAAVIVLTSPGLECTRALAAAVERPEEPGRLPLIVPQVGTGAAGAASTSLPAIGAEVPVLPPQAEFPGAQAGTPNATSAPQEALAVVPAIAPAVAPEPARTETGLVERLERVEGRLDRALDAPGSSAAPETVREASAIFEPSKAASGDSSLGFISRVTWTMAGRNLSVQKHADRLLDEGQDLVARADAARRLGEIKSKETIELLGETAAGDAPLSVREEAKKALGSLAERWAPVLLRELRLHPRSGRRAAAARSLGWIARFSSDVRIVDALSRQSALDINHDVRLTAIHSLSQAQSPKALAALIELRRLATKADIISASEIAIHDAISLQQAAGQAIAPYHAPPGEFGSSKQPLYALALKRVIAVSAVFTAIEFVGGLLIGSLSLKADSMHLLADLGINVGALFALWMSRRPPNSHKTYGYLKMESLTGLLSAVAIAAMAVLTLTEAVPRLWAPVAVPGLATIALAFSGLLSNAISTLLLYRYQEDNLSLKGAFLHAATDAVGSVGIIIGGALIYFFGWFIADPLISFLIVALILHTTWDLARRSWNVLIDAVPPGVKIDELESDLLAVPGVASVYDLHVWSLNSSEKALTAILYVKPGADLEGVLTAAKAVVGGKHEIGHSTLQVERLKPPH